MSYPGINEARALAKRHRQTVLIIFYADEEHYGYTSYGKDREHCGKAKQIADEMYDEFLDAYMEIMND